MKKEFARDLIDYIYASPTAFNAVETSKSLLVKNGFEELQMNKKWKLKIGGKYFITKNSSSLIAFVINCDNVENGFRIIGSHSDSPTFRIKPNAEMTVGNTYLKLNTEADRKSVV